ncbi:hypothetical protein C8F04DRAFT_1110969 [Mycena alexandri]|uniref:Antibiotic biosynthesis monooxygenase n=1 Tax=Mycena alexandri TaxID=1745969 RepID=A0AAD6WXV8_9AGAR|nr:hypothetical protein C8F04DRAFT_1110829 [Mycena alexandri]KAJ7031373.1 hypothetical protein C8F04DRAFT_1110969 [Mycena alexandri]
MPSSEVTLALYVPLLAKSDKIDDLHAFLGAGYDLVQEEPETIQWYGIRYDDHSPPTFAILDTFRGESGRKAHLTGKVAEALGANAPTLLASGPEIHQPVVVVNKVTQGKKTKTAGLGVGIRVLLTAKPDKVETVKSFLAGALPLFEAETETLNAYILQFPGTDRFAIVDFFENDAGRNAHLGGEIAKQLFANADAWLAVPPDVVKFTVIAASVNV